MTLKRNEFGLFNESHGKMAYRGGDRLPAYLRPSLDETMSTPSTGLRKMGLDVL